MGAGSSKPEAAGDSKHVFSSNSPVQFSSNLVEALQNNGETDASRTKAVELEIQNRVALELKRLHEREQQTLAEIEKRIASSKDTGSIPISSSTGPTAKSSTGQIGSLNLDAPRIPFAGREHDAPSFTAPAETPAQGQGQDLKRDVSSTSVNSEIEALRSRLDGRRKLVELDDEVAKAQTEVIGCLRLHDRRPLNCWKEVDAFKKEVAKMEAAFVDRIVG